MNNQDKSPEVITPNLPLWSYQLQQDSKLAVKTRKDLEIHLITRALKDEGFRQELIANPKAVVEKEIGTKLPEELEIMLLEETEDTLYMVLPCNPYEGMSEEELKALVGMTYEDVAHWIFDQQRTSLLDEASAVAIFSRAWQDQTFRQELLSTPKAVVQNELQIMISDVEICVLEESVHHLYIVLPKVADNFELPSQDLLESSLFSMNLVINVGSGGGGPVSNWTQTPSCLTHDLTCQTLTNGKFIC
jgi:Nitrile hydratase, alpha chain